ncbi:MAG: MFS transporter [Deinococcales bacterium]
MTATKGTPTTGLWAATLGFFFGFASVSVFGPTAHQLAGPMHLSAGQIGLLVAVPSLSGSLLRIPFAAWVDTSGGRKPFLTLLIMSIVGMAGLALVIHTLYPDHLTRGFFPLLLLLGLLCGSGIATFSVGIGQVSYWFPQRTQGFALGTYAGVGNLAPGMFSFLLPVALSSYGLGTAYLAWLAFLVVGTALYFALGQNAPFFQLRQSGATVDAARARAQDAGQELFPAGSAVDTLVHSARVWRTWILVLLYFTTFGGFLALTAWLPTYWLEYLKTTAVAAGALTALYSLLASAIRVPGGSLADRLGGERTALLSLGTTLLGAAIMTFSGHLALSVAGVVLMALGMGVNNAAVFKLVPRVVPHAVGGAAGWVGGLGAFGGFVIPPVMALFVGGGDATGYATGFVVFVVLAAAAILAALLLHVTPLAARPAPTPRGGTRV